MTKEDLIKRLGGLKIKHTIESPELAAQGIGAQAELDESDWGEEILPQLEAAGLTIVEIPKGE